MSKATLKTAQRKTSMSRSFVRKVIIENSEGLPSIKTTKPKKTASSTTLPKKGTDKISAAEKDCL